MFTPETEPAPFVRGERVIYRPRPSDDEIVQRVEYRREGWGGWYVETGPAGGCGPQRYDRAERFDPATRSSTTTAAVLRRLARAAGGVALALLILGVLWGALVELPQ